MRERRLGKTGIKIAEIGFGCWPIGGTSYGATRDEDSLEALNAAFDSGVNFFDTADVYGEGHSEALLKQFLQSKRRDQIIIATKIGWDFYHGGHKKNFTEKYLREACDKSLERLGVEQIDLLQLHNPSLETIQQRYASSVLEKLKKEGKVRAVGVSVHTESEAFAALQDHNIQTIQVIFNLLDQRMSERIFPEADKRSVGVIVREPLASGILSRKYPPTYTFPKNDHRARWSPQKRAADWEKIDKMKQVLRDRKKLTSLTRASLELALSFDAVSVVIPGAKNKEQVLQNVAAGIPDLEAEDLNALEVLYNQEPIFQKELNPQ